MKAVRRMLSIIAVTLLAGAPGAAAPYENYLYTHDGRAMREPQAFTPCAVIDEDVLGTALSAPEDFCTVSGGGLIIADTGNDRVLILDRERRITQELTDMGDGVPLAGPQGVCLQGDSLFIADTGNTRVVRYGLADGSLYVYGKPNVPVEEAFEFKPVKVAADSAMRLYVVCEGVNRGMVELDATGEFVSFYGANRVSPSPMDIFWRRFMTEEQINNLESVIPTEYSNVCADAEDFVFGTVAAQDREKLHAAIRSRDADSPSIPVRRLNPLGKDILRKNGDLPPAGDYVEEYIDNQPVVSAMIDVCVGPHGTYSLLDGTAGRVFTYDAESNLLFTFGGLGDEFGAFGRPAAVDVDDAGRYYVLDSLYSQLVAFSPTEYAGLVLTAVGEYSQRRYARSEASWRSVLNYTVNSNLAYVGMGKSRMRQTEYRDAMRYFKLGHHQSLYSEAFDLYRNTLIARYFDVAATILAALAAALTGLLAARRIRGFTRKRKEGGRG